MKFRYSEDLRRLQGGCATCALPDLMGDAHPRRTDRRRRLTVRRLHAANCLAGIERPGRTLRSGVSSCAAIKGLDRCGEGGDEENNEKEGGGHGTAAARAVAG